MEQYVLLGYIVGSHGLDGTLKIMSTTDFAKERYKENNVISLYSQKTKERKELTVSRFRKSGQYDLVTTREINTKEEADALKSYEVQALKDKSMLKEGYYYYADLEGCKVLDQTGKNIGEVEKVEEFPAQLTLDVKGNNGKHFFVPFIKAFIKNVDIEKKEITIEVIEGML